MDKNIEMKETLIELSDKKNIPITATLELLTKCNFRCRHCYIPDYTHQMEFEQVSRLLKEMKELGVLYLTLTGGEIFVHNDIMKIIQYARELGMSVSLFSNGYLINREILSALKEMYVSDISITIFSMKDSVNDNITGVSGSLQRILHNVDLILEYGIPLEIKTPIMSLNRREAKAVKLFCEERNIKFNYTVEIVSKLNGDKTPVENYTADINDLVYELYDMEYTKTQNQKKGFHETDLLCGALRHNISIDFFGNVNPCNSFPIVYGNVFEESLYDIWYKSKVRKQLLLKSKRDLHACVKCQYKDDCLRCPGIAQSENGDYLSCAPQCKHTVEAFKKMRELLF